MAEMKVLCHSFLILGVLCFAHVTGPPNNTTSEPASNANTLGFIDYKIANWDSSPTHQHSRMGRKALSSQGNGLLKGKTTSRVAQALVFGEWVKVYNF